MTAKAPAAGGRAWGGGIFLGPGTILFIGPGGTADRHAHHAVQFVWALEGTFTLDMAEPVERQATLIPGGVPHTFAAVGRRIAILLVEPHGARGAALERSARSSPGEEVATSLVGVPFPTAVTAADAERWSETVLSALGAEGTTAPITAVSRRAIAYIEGAIHGRPELGEAARRAGVSATRLTHVFTQEVGIPFRRFVLWTRIKHAVTATQQGADLTQAALAAGFSDSAHLSRTFRAMFGLSPSLVLPLAQVTGSPWSAST